MTEACHAGHSHAVGTEYSIHRNFRNAHIPFPHSQERSELPVYVPRTCLKHDNLGERAGSHLPGHRARLHRGEGASACTSPTRAPRAMVQNRTSPRGDTGGGQGWALTSAHSRPSRAREGEKARREGSLLKRVFPPAPSPLPSPTSGPLLPATARGRPHGEGPAATQTPAATEMTGE